MNILKTTELYTLNGQIVLYLNYLNKAVTKILQENYQQPSYGDNKHPNFLDHY